LNPFEDWQTPVSADQWKQVRDALELKAQHNVKRGFPSIALAQQRVVQMMDEMLAEMEWARDRGR
jgi:hypothetical protein